MHNSCQNQQKQQKQLFNTNSTTYNKQTQAQNAANDSIFYTSTHPFFPSITNQLQTALFLTGMAPTSNQVDT
ncbi:hypothetical protein JYT77_00370 [bacterium AH-315-K15]|nr:hypothetical protein [bacterium AH-315-K15]